MSDAINILLVDDEQKNLDSLAAILDNADYRLLRAQDADAALKLLLDHEVAAILLDIKMPGISGFELAKIVKATKRYRNIPIVFLTAYHLDDEDVLSGYGAGAVDYLTKPLKPEIVRHKVAVFAELFVKTRALAELNERLEQRVKERTADLEKSEEALRLGNKAKDEFIATLSHELRNPMAALRMGLDLLARYVTPSPNSTKTLETINRQLVHLVRLVDDLLDLSRISRGVIELRKESVDLVGLCREAVESHRSAAGPRSFAFELAGPEKVMAVVDPARITQIIDNLLQNAIKFTPVDGKISVRLKKEADAAVVQVVDSGRGVPPEDLERVFQMFTRLDGGHASSQPSLGIGLAVGRRLAQLHQGTLVAQSEGPNRGATFTLRLPYTGASAAEAAAPPQPAVTPPDVPALDVLVVEDNEDVALMLVEWLKLMGHRVSVAQTGAEGVRLVEEQQPQVVLCDLGLPELDGLQVCRQVRALPLPRQPWMVALSGWGRDVDRERTRQAGFDNHLVKPVAAEELAELLRYSSRPRAR